MLDKPPYPLLESALDFPTSAGFQPNSHPTAGLVHPAMCPALCFREAEDRRPHILICSLNSHATPTVSQGHEAPGKYKGPGTQAPVRWPPLLSQEEKVTMIQDFLEGTGTRAPLYHLHVFAYGTKAGKSLLPWADSQSCSTSGRQGDPARDMGSPQL